MRRNPTLRIRLLMGGLAATGVVVAHAIAYVLATPDPHSRSELLESTGHSGFSNVVAVALGLLVAGLVRFAAGRIWGPRAEVSGRRLYALAVPRLLVLQVGGFVALEATERTISGLGPAHLLIEPAAGIGLVVQVLVALIGAGLIVLFAKTFEKLFGIQSFAPEARAGSVPAPASRLAPPRFAVAAGAGTLRGPPFFH